MKTAKDYLDEANAVVRKIEFDEAIEKHKDKLFSYLAKMQKNFTPLYPSWYAKYKEGKLSLESLKEAPPTAKEKEDPWVQAFYTKLSLEQREIFWENWVEHGTYLYSIYEDFLCKISMS